MGALVAPGGEMLFFKDSGEKCAIIRISEVGEVLKELLRISGVF